MNKMDVSQNRQFIDNMFILLLIFFNIYSRPEDLQGTVVAHYSNEACVSLMESAEDSLKIDTSLYS